MQNIKVETKVSLLSGAEVQLTDNQLNQVAKMIYSMLFDAPAVEAPVKRKYTRRIKKLRWTPEEDAPLISIINTSDKSDKIGLYKKIKKQLNRSSSSMYNRAYYLKKQQDASKLSQINQSNLPVYINTTWS